MNLFNSGVRPAIDEYLKKKSEEERNYGSYWSASSAGYCMRKVIYDRLGVPKTREDARLTRVFEAGHIFHSWVQGITKDAGISIAQELELQDEDLMVRGHFDDLVLVWDKVELDLKNYDPENPVKLDPPKKHLILYDYKTQSSRAFSYQKDRDMSYFHYMQLGTYMLMMRRLLAEHTKPAELDGHHDLTEGRIMKISKDDLRMTEEQLLWSDELEKEILDWWNKLNKHWADMTLPPCTCADKEGGFMAREKFNDYWYNGEPCSLDLYKKAKAEGILKDATV